MKEIRVFPKEYQFCRILWENEPVTTTKLVLLCREKLNWSKSTTYTVIRRLAERKIIKKDRALCCSLISKFDVQYLLITDMISEYFDDYSEFAKIVSQIQFCLLQTEQKSIVD